MSPGEVWITYNLQASGPPPHTARTDLGPSRDQDCLCTYPHVCWHPIISPLLHQCAHPQLLFRLLTGPPFWRIAHHGGRPHCPGKSCPSAPGQPTAQLTEMRVGETGSFAARGERRGFIDPRLYGLFPFHISFTPSLTGFSRNTHL